MKKKLIWNTYIFNSNQNSFEKYNIFSNATFLNDVEKVAKEYKKIKENDLFEEKIRVALAYQFWGRYEYEINISDIIHNDIVNKVDVYDQIMMNFDRLIEYIKKEFKL